MELDLQTATTIATILVVVALGFIIATFAVLIRARKHLKQQVEIAHKMACVEKVDREIFFRKTLSGEEGYHLNIYGGLDS